MSYPLGLDEVEERDLLGELENRRKLRVQGLCDYCGRHPETPACKFPERHHLFLGAAARENKGHDHC